MDWSSVAGQVVNLGAPILGRVLGGAIGGPAGSIVGSKAGEMLATILGVPATPQAVAEAIRQNPEKATAVVQKIETEHGQELERLQAEIGDREGARSYSTTLVESGSNLRWGAAVISTLIVIGFAISTVLAVFRPAGVEQGVVLFILGAWVSFMGSVVSFWLGSSSGSQRKDDTIGQFIEAARVTKPSQKGK